MIIIKKKSVKTLLILSISLILVSSNNIFASENSYPENIEYSDSMRASKYIASYTVWIQNAGGGKLLLTCLLDTVGFVDKLEIQSFKLQESFDGVSWKTVQTWNRKATDIDYVVLSTSYQGKIGYLYRVSATFYAEKNGDSETKTCITDTAYAAQ